MHITNVSPSTRQSKQWLGEGKQFFSLTVTSLPTSTLPTFSQIGSRGVQLCSLPSGSNSEIVLPKHADNSIAPEVATIQPVPANTDMPTSSVNSQDMDRMAALSRIDAAYSMHLKYLQYNLWSGEEETNFGNSSPSPCLANWAEQAEPLPAVLERELANSEAMKTIRENPNLFKIVTPINVDHFENLLESHPNHPFVESVCRGLQEGFWPWVDTHYESC